MTDTAFHDVRFPLDIALGSSGTLTRKTDIVAFGSGQEQRNGRWAGSKRRYQAGVGVKTLSDLESVVHFFEERRGKLHGFRFRDPFDHASSKLTLAPSALDQALGEGDGEKTTFALIKTYGDASYAFTRRIHKPVLDEVLVAVGGSVLQPNDYSVDDQGVVTLNTAPAAGALVTAGFSFDVPVRFASDELMIDLEAFGAGSIPDIPLIELLF